MPAMTRKVWLIADMVAQNAKRSRKQNLTKGTGDPGNDVDGGRYPWVIVQRVVTEHNDTEDRRFWSMQQLDDRNANWIGDQTTAADSDKHKSDPNQNRPPYTDFLHQQRNQAHHDSFQEHFN